MASSVSSLRDCEKWRGDILKEISRKVSKIQDAGLTDYAIRDLNDEINGLMREKSHWERQIVALGGANYSRGRQAMVDDDGKEVPGTRGYKYFGRAKELPGVREMFQSKGGSGSASAPQDSKLMLSLAANSAEETEESARQNAYRKFMNQGPAYFGDVDEVDEELVREERDMERRGETVRACRREVCSPQRLDWNAAFERLRQELDLPEDETPPPFPQPAPVPASASTSAAQGTSSTKRKHRAADGEQDADMEEGGGDKRVKPSAAVTSSDGAVSLESAAAANIANFMGVIDLTSLQPPPQPTKEEMERILLEARKKALIAEYGV